MKFRITSIFLFFSFAVIAQIQFFRNDSIPVFHDTTQLLHPWAGGMNFCQFSTIDLDQDGTQDLFVFDRTGNKITTYRNNGIANQVDYTLAPQYVFDFPRLRDWVLLRDYNCDGKMDIFTAGGALVPGIAVWKNISTTSTGLQFQLVTDTVRSNLMPNSTNILQTIFISSVDVPAIRDVDSDGDLDILTFDAAGVYIEFHRNMSQENLGNCDSLWFQIESLCWGEIAENTLNANLVLNDSCGPPSISGSEAAGERHNGSCLECIMTNGDADVDILIGDLTNNRIVYGRNGGNISYAEIDLVDNTFPVYDTAAFLQTFICGYHLDVNNDGANDLVVSPNAQNVSENFKGNWLYLNTTMNDSCVFAFNRRNFLQGDMIETGAGAYPRFFDYDGDGDEDLFIGNQGYYSSSGIYPGKIALYKNIGSASFPSYKLMTDDFSNVHVQAPVLAGPVPAFSDLDGDGDADMLVGDADGKLTYFRKDPGPDDNFLFAQANYMGIDVGNSATPQLIDLTGDGLTDLLIGEQNGTINYYVNNGTSTSPNFALVTVLFGNVDVRQPGFSTGYSVPFVWNNNGTFVLLVGSERGYVYKYDDVNSATFTGTFTLTDSMYVSAREGLRVAPWMAEITGDTLPDLIIGNYAGGVSIFKGSTSVGMTENTETVSFDIFPNPATDFFYIKTSLPFSALPAEICIANLAGQIFYRTVINESNSTISTENLSPGVYIVTLRTATGEIAHGKLITGIAKD
ncbi:MAG TPA: FG-GAP-like repeat-containing protein [Bacteroidia bacterium]|nr:FG-GAP-like repeat-containing protein [Bacteroidia bacterium]